MSEKVYPPRNLGQLFTTGVITSKCTNDIKYVLEEQHKKWQNTPLPADWDIGKFPIALPRQPPGSRECGPFALEFAEYVSRRIINVRFASDSGPHIRERLLYELVTEKLLSRHCNPSFF